MTTTPPRPSLSMDKRLTAARPDLAAKHLEGIIDAKNFVEGSLREVRVDVAPLYAAANFDAPRETELLFGEQFTIYEENNGWAWGQSRLDNYVGYMPTIALDAPQSGHNISVKALRSYIFSKPDIKSKPLHLVSMNALLKSTKSEGRFLALASGGYIIADHVMDINQHSHDFVLEAEKFLGTPYLWGGRSSLGLDCSALVQNALARIGMMAPRDTDMQEQQIGTQIAKTHEETPLQRGDLVFWKGHVAIMQDPHHIIHANGTWMQTTIDRLDKFANLVHKDSGPVTSIKRIS